MNESTPKIMWAEDLLDAYPGPLPVLIDGVLRVKELMNIIAPPKAGKSRLVLDLAISVATGRPWLGFACQQGKVLLIDNEMHQGVITTRIEKICAARGVPLEELGDRLVVDNQFGHIESIEDFGNHLEEIKRQGFKLIIIDALYRALPNGADVCNRVTVRQVYNLIDSYAAKLGCAFALVHHTPGEEALGFEDLIESYADTHVSFRPHGAPDVFVMETAVSSFPPVPPVKLHHTFPVWNRVEKQ